MKNIFKALKVDIQSTYFAFSSVIHIAQDLFLSHLFWLGCMKIFPGCDFIFFWATSV